MARGRSPDREKAKVVYIKSLGRAKLVDIAAEIGVSDTQIRKWKSIDKWDDELKGTLPNVISNVTKQNKKVGGQPGNKNAYGNKGGKGGPVGNLKNLKHGAYANIYTEHLSADDKELIEAIGSELSLDDEITILKLKIARLLNRERSFFYDMFGTKHQKDISEEDRERGIIICMDQLRKLVETQAKINHDVEKFAFDKYKTEVDLQLKKEKLELLKRKEGEGEGDNDAEDDGFIDALSGKVDDIWSEQ